MLIHIALIAIRGGWPESVYVFLIDCLRKNCFSFLVRCEHRDPTTRLVARRLTVQGNEICLNVNYACNTLSRVDELDIVMAFVGWLSHRLKPVTAYLSVTLRFAWSVVDCIYGKDEGRDSMDCLIQCLDDAPYKRQAGRQSHKISIWNS